jgi:hypothetical protein
VNANSDGCDSTPPGGSAAADNDANCKAIPDSCTTFTSAYKNVEHICECSSGFGGPHCEVRVFRVHGTCHYICGSSNLHACGGHAFLDGTICGTVEQTSTDGPGTTYRLSLSLSGTAKNVYSIYGSSAANPLSMPPAYQDASPGRADIGGVDPAWFGDNPTAAFDSWLTIGATTGLRQRDGSQARDALSQSLQHQFFGIDFDAWTASTGITTENGAMHVAHNLGPGSANAATHGLGPAGEVVVAQLTIMNAKPFTATLGAKGQSANGVDWEVEGITFSAY